MAVIKNILETAFKVSGTSNIKQATKKTDEYAESVNKVGRESIRASNVSGAAGRRFASQARGLGGFVGVYAGAAASVFALSQAYETLSRAARVETTIAGTKALARTVGSSSTQILADIEKITQGQLSIAQSAEVANIALSAGFNSEQIAELTNVAVKASRALGRDLTDSLNRVTRGVAKLEPELLDELGIFTKLGPATEKYAASLGLSVSELTEFQRRQAFANAAIEEGNRKYQLIQVSASSTQAVLERLAATFSNLIQKSVSTIANLVAPVLESLTENAGNLYTAFIAISAIVFRNLGKELAFMFEGLSKGFGVLERKTSKYKAGITSVQKAFDDLAGRTINPQGTQVPSIGEFFKQEGGRGFVGLSKEGNNQARLAVELATSGDIKSFNELKESIPILKQVQEAEEKYQKTKEKEIEKIKKANLSKEEELKLLNQKNKLLDQSAARQLVATEIMQAFSGKMDTATGRTKIFAAFTGGLTRVINVLNTALSFASKGLFALTGALGVAQLAASFFGVDIIGGLIEKLTSLFQVSKDVKRGIEGIAAAALNSREAKIKELFPDPKDIKEINENIQSIVKKFSDFDPAKGSLLGNAPTSKFYDFNILPQNTDEILKNLGLTREQIINGDEALKGFTNNILSLAKEAENFKEPKQILAFKVALEDLEKIFISELIGQLERITGLPVDQLSNQISSLRGESEGFFDSIKIGGVVVAEYEKGQFKLIEGNEKLFSTTLLYKDASDRLNESLSSGNATAESASQGLEAVRKKVSELTKEINSYTEEFFGPPAALIADLGNATAELEKQRKAVVSLIRAENDLSFVRSKYSKEIKALETARAEGLIDANGAIATSDAEVQRNRVSALKEIVDTGQKAAKQLQSIGVLNDISKSTLETQKEASEAAIKAGIGIALTLPTQAKKLTKELENRVKVSGQEISLLIIQNQIAQARQVIEAETTRQQVEQAKAQANISLAQARVNIVSEELAQVQKLFDLGKKRLEVERELADQTARAQSSAEALASTRRQIDISRRIRDLQRQETLQQEQPYLFSRSDRQNLQRSIIIEEYRLQKEILEERERQAQEEYKRSIDALNRKQQDTIREITQLDAVETKRAEIFEKEKQVRNQQQELERARITGQTSLLELRQAEIASQKTLQLEQIELDKEKKLADLDTLKSQYDLLRETAKVYKEFLEKYETIVNAQLKAIGEKGVSSGSLTSGLDNILEKFDADGEFAKKFKTLKADIIESARLSEEGVVNQASAQAANNQTQIDAKNAILRQTNKLFAAETALEQAKRDSERRERDEQVKLLNLKLESYEQERIALENANTEEALRRREELDILEENTKERLRQLTVTEDKITNLSKSIGSLVENKIGSAFDDLFDSIASGTLTLQTFKDGVLSLFKDLLTDIAKEVFRQEVSQPASKAIAGLISTGISAIFSAGAPTDVGPTGMTFAEELAGGYRPVAGGGYIDNTGSVQHFAEGGGVQLRDRVPALLEPGEFVIRKPIVNAVGAQNLKQLNATGSMNSGANIKVELDNSGSPKQAEQGPVYFDGEKAVVRVILKDLQNNGPIRKSLRGTR